MGKVNREIVNKIIIIMPREKIAGWTDEKKEAWKVLESRMGRQE